MRSDRISGTCALCGAQARLEQSHIIPRFVYRGLEIPDGLKRPLLCGACEDQFSEYESAFARVVFHPLVTDPRLVAKYGKWLLQFSVSVCWRVLEEHRATTQSAEPESRWAVQMASCRETWRQFLRGKRSDIGEHPMHLLRSPGSATVEMKVVCRDHDSFVCARLGPVILLGMIADPDAAQWQGTRVHLEGKLKTREIFVPARYRAHILSRS
jgi:hypothetical protein